MLETSKASTTINTLIVKMLMDNLWTISRKPNHLFNMKVGSSETIRDAVIIDLITWRSSPNFDEN